MSPRMRPVWTQDEVIEYCTGRVTTSVDVAAAIFGMSRSAAYGAINRGTFPVPVIKPSQRGWHVPTAAILQVLELTSEVPTHG